MRVLGENEMDSVAGGLGEGTKIPFISSYWKGPNFPGGPAMAVPAIAVAYELGFALGEKINQFNQSFSNMSLGVAAFRTVQQFGGGSNILSGGTTRIEEV
jgi:hypothetical protein